jgi:transposase-like protein
MEKQETIIQKKGMPICRYCSSNAVVRFGTYKGNQRYWCKSCLRKFKADDALFYSRISANHISSALIMYYCNKSIDDIRDYLKKEHDYYPSKSVVFRWISKYTGLAGTVLSKDKPETGDDWIAIKHELIERRFGKIKFIDIFDNRTCYLLASFASLNESEEDIQTALKQAVKAARKTPRILVTDSGTSNPEGIEVIFSTYSRPEKSKLFQNADYGNNIKQLKRIIEERDLLLHNLKSFESVSTTLKRFAIHYNYFKSYHSLGGKTPAQSSGIIYPYKSWADIIRQPLSGTLPAKN